MDAILARFRDHTMDLFKKHGIEVVGFWVTDIGERSYGELVYLVVWSDLNAREAGWTAFRNDADWQATGAIGTNQNDRYSNLIIGYLNVRATQAGDWQFRRLSDDDQIGIWLDLDRNCIFESDPVGFGSNRG